MLDIEYGKPEWGDDTEAANAEAQRRAILTRDAENAAEREAIWFSDLGALMVLPAELAEIDGLRRLIVGDAKTPDGKDHTPTQKVADVEVLRFLPQLTELNLVDSGIITLETLAGLTALQSLFINNTQVSDLTPLKGLTALQSLYISGTQVSDLTPLKRLAALQSLDITGTQVSDLTPLKGLAALQGLDISNTQVSDLTPLKGLAALQSLYIIGTQISDLTPLKGLAALQSLYISGTEVSDLTPLKGLVALQKLDIRRTQVSDLSPVLEIPRFAAGEGKMLYFAGTPAARQDPRWEMLAAISAARAAREVPLYLRGEHPDLQPPKEGSAQARGVAGMAAGSPVRLQERDGRAELADDVRYQPPATGTQGARGPDLTDLRAQLAPLLPELEDGRNVDPRLLRRVQGYAQVCEADAPVFATLEGTMVMIRPMVGDGYTRDALDPGLVAGLDRLVALHDALGVKKAVPEILPPLPEVPATPDQGALVEGTVRDLQDAVREAQGAGLVGVTVVQAINSTVDITVAANAPLPPEAGEAEEKERKGWWSWVLRMAGGIAEGLAAYGKIHDFARTPAGVTLMQKLQEIVAVLMQFF